MPHPTFPNSIMFRAVEQGASRMSFNLNGGNALVQAAGPSRIDAVRTISGAASTTRANLLAALSVSKLTYMSLAVTTSSAGVTFTQGGSSIVIPAGGKIELGTPDSLSLDPIDDFTITTLAGDVVLLQLAGYA